MSRRFPRRHFLPAAGAAAVAAMAGKSLTTEPAHTSLPDSPVAIIKAPSYSGDLHSRILDGLRLCGLNVRGKNVLLKPNLVEFEGATVVNTHAAVLAAAVEVLEKLGAAQVRIGEGPGHRRDTFGLTEQSLYRESIARFDERFVDLNLDDVSLVKTAGPLGDIYLPNAALEADLVVSVAKMKTHHWVGATLSMKNFFGMVPGAVYGWPKNYLHQTGIPASIIELNRIFRKTFAIVDGIIGMEGDGPIMGTPKPCGVLVMGVDLVAVDATCCRIMGMDPERISYIQQAAELGNFLETRITQRGENIESVRSPFRLSEAFQHLRLS